ncbi:MAG: hypothetical protein Q9191_004327 [Dirinaria sp. TL-2023a]
MSGRDRGSRGRGDRGRGGDRGGGGGGGGRGRGRGGDSRGGTFSGFAPRGRPGGSRQQAAEIPQIYKHESQIARPSKEVTQAEDKYAQAIKGAGLPDISKLKISEGHVEFPPRPGYGTRGTEVVLLANYFELTPRRDLQLYRYELKVTEGKKETRVAGKKLKRVFELLLEMDPLRSHRSDIVTDFKAFLISRVKLSSEQLELLPTEIQYRPEGEDEARKHDPKYGITVTAAGSVAVSDLINHLTSTDPEATFDKQPILQALNIFLGHYAKKSPDHTTVGANRSFSRVPQPQDSADLGKGLRAIRGFFSSVRVATARILVNVNISHAAFYDPLPLPVAMDRFGLVNKFKLQAFLKRVRVRLNHLPSKTNKDGSPIPRIKTIYGLANKSDGKDDEHPPRVPTFGAGPKEVQFWLSEPSPESSASKPFASGAPASGKASGKKGKSKEASKSSSGTPSTGGGNGKYISVYDYFEKSRAPLR